MDIKEQIHGLTEEMLTNLGRLVAIDSQLGTPAEGKPFGEGPAKALEEGLKIAQELGFKTVNLDNYCGYAEMGEGDEIVGIAGHLDIVPVGGDWSYDPFKLTREGDYVYGRGTTDDKGPVLEALYAMKLLRWKDKGKDFFLPIKVISKTFRGKYMAKLKQLWENDRLEFHGSAAPYKNYYTFKELLNTCYAKEWIPYCKKPFDGAESVIRYLGKYTHRIAISNYRIKGMTESTVTFSAKDYKNQGHWKEITLSGEEFIRRFLMHVPPKRFVRIRHYGLLASRNKKKKIALCRNILGCKKYISKLKDMDAPAIIRLLYNKDICKCSSCGGKIIPLPTEQHFIKPKPHTLC